MIFRDTQTDKHCIKIYISPSSSSSSSGEDSFWKNLCPGESFGRTDWVGIVSGLSNRQLEFRLFSSSVFSSSARKYIYLLQIFSFFFFLLGKTMYLPSQIFSSFSFSFLSSSLPKSIVSFSKYFLLSFIFFFSSTKKYILFFKILSLSIFLVSKKYIFLLQYSNVRLSFVDLR